MERFAASDGSQIAYSDSGTGASALLFVHGWQADSSVWAPLIAALGPRVRTIAVDLRGSGASHAAAGPYRLERYASDLRELIEALGIVPVVVGHSMGATVALRLAVDAPQVVRGLVLIAPVPAGGAGFSAKGEAYLRATAGNPDAAKQWLLRTMLPNGDTAVLQRLCEAAAKTPAAVALESFGSWAHADFAEATRSINVPALIVAPAGENPEAAERNVAAFIAGARYTVLSDAAHYAIVERPEAIASLIREHGYTDSGGRMTSELARRACIPCRGGVPPLDDICNRAASRAGRSRLARRGTIRREARKRQAANLHPPLPGFCPSNASSRTHRRDGRRAAPPPRSAGLLGAPGR